MNSFVANGYEGVFLLTFKIGVKDKYLIPVSFQNISLDL